MRIANRIAAALGAALVLHACNPSPPEPSSSPPEVTVTAAGETEPVGTANEDAADDPAIWRNPDDPAASLIIGTDKKAGHHLYGLDGKSRHFEAGGLLNNVDIADLGAAGVIVAASDRNGPENAAIRLYRLDTATAKLVSLGTVEAGEGQAYGLCLFAMGDALHAVSVLKEGTIEEYRLEGLYRGETPRTVPVLTRNVASQPEGCVVDPRDGTLYVGEELRGIWRFASGSANGRLVAETDSSQLVADVEGLAILPHGGDGGWLVASSQGDNAFALYRLPEVSPAGRFRIGKGQFGATEETDGIAVDGRDFGPAFPGGLFVAQDGKNDPAAQNFKLVSWRAIMETIGE